MSEKFQEGLQYGSMFVGEREKKWLIWFLLGPGDRYLGERLLDVDIKRQVIICVQTITDMLFRQKMLCGI